MQWKMTRWMAVPALAGMLVGQPSRGGGAEPAGAWIDLGPHGGTVVGLAADPAHGQTVYAAVETAGVLKSVDGGASWTAINQGLGASSLQTVTVGPDGAVYLGAALNMWRSVDGGASWRSLSPAGSELGALQFAFDARSKTTIYITDGFALWKSADGGATWSRHPIEPSGSQLHVEAIAAHPRRSGVVLAGTTAGVFRSLDGGASWQQVQATCLGAALLFDPLRPQRVYAGCLPSLFYGLADSGVIQSLDGGATWQPAAAGLGTLSVVALAAPPGVPRTVYAGTFGGGVFRTTDAGAHWQPVAAGIETTTVGSLAVSPRMPAVLYAGAGRGGAHLAGAAGLGVFRSADAGASWAPANDGIDGIRISAVVGDSSIPGLLLAAAPAGGYFGLGVFRSRDGGVSWRLAGNGMVELGVADVSIDRLAAAPGRFYALGSKQYLYASADRGRSWAALPALPGDPTLGGLAADPRDSSHVLVGGPGASLDSHDGGETWQVAATGQGDLIRSFAFSPSAPGLVYGAGEFPYPPLAPPGGRFFRSADGGATWVGVGPPDLVLAVAVDAADGDTVYACVVNQQNGGTVKVSRDGGTTWKDAGLTGLALAAAASPTVPGLAVVAGALSGPVPGSASHRVWITVDHGATWSPIDDGIPARLGVTNFAFEPARPQVLLAGTTGGVFELTLPPGATRAAAAAGN